MGPLQLLMVGFESTERFRGDIARELGFLRGRGLLRVVDARLFHRAADGRLSEIDLNPLLGDPPAPANPIAHLLGANGGGSNGGASPQDAFQRTAGFALEDLRQLTAEVEEGEYVAAVLVEHVWATDLRSSVLEAGGRLVAQGFLTPEVSMIVGSEIKARAEARIALEIAEAARGEALLEALSTIATRDVASPAERAQAAAKVVDALVKQGFVHPTEAGDAVDALISAGLLESAVVEAAVSEAEDVLGER